MARARVLADTHILYALYKKHHWLMRGATFSSLHLEKQTAALLAGVDESVFKGIEDAITADRFAFMSAFLADFYNVDVLDGERVSDQVIQASWNVALGASAKGALDCVQAWLTDFRADLPRIDVPTLIIHGDADRTLPIDATAIPLAKSIAGARLDVVPGGPHGLIWTHAAEVNSALFAFLR
ncbi:alpha/beta fold hydrolase [Streptomyces sp. NPDC006704]|uniref:alpha/beta fold hydrolase n=1 Tax=Streptomyces sp. NPDC006704 TaxID=3364760 RepID=UPI00369D3E66